MLVQHEIIIDVDSESEYFMQRSRLGHPDFQFLILSVIQLLIYEKLQFNFNDALMLCGPSLHRQHWQSKCRRKTERLELAFFLRSLYFGFMDKSE